MMIQGKGALCKSQGPSLITADSGAQKHEKAKALTHSKLAE